MGLSVADPLGEAAVFFYSQSQHWSRRLLRPGFRHCDVCLATELPGVWVAAIGKIGGILAPVVVVDFDPEAYARQKGAQLVLLPGCQPMPRRVPLMVTTCVGVVKAVLGIRAPWIITPLQLYRYLTR